MGLVWGVPLSQGICDPVLCRLATGHYVPIFVAGVWWHSLYAEAHISPRRYKLLHPYPLCFLMRPAAILVMHKQLLSSRTWEKEGELLTWHTLSPQGITTGVAKPSGKTVCRRHSYWCLPCNERGRTKGNLNQVGFSMFCEKKNLCSPRVKIKEEQDTCGSDSLFQTSVFRRNVPAWIILNPYQCQRTRSKGLRFQGKSPKHGQVWHRLVAKTSAGFS